MDICNDIEQLQECSAKAAACYSQKAIFGNGKHSDVINISKLNAYIRVLSRNQVKYEKVTTALATPTTVSMSSLVSQNNMLILPTSTSSTECVKVESCLSEDEICKILESAKKLCSLCNC